MSGPDRQGGTGTRIRQRRLDLGLKQVDLARSCGISASYLNLIEHGRRPIGGALLLDLARMLDAEPTLLAESGSPELIATLREAASERSTEEPGPESAEDFASRHPGWAAIVRDKAMQVGTLEKALASLGERLAHDGPLAEILHEVLSAAAAMRSAATILSEPGEIDPAWRRRFLRTITEDSRRLATGAEALVERVGAQAAAAVEALIDAPGEQAEAWLSERPDLASRLAAAGSGHPPRSTLPTDRPRSAGDPLRETRIDGVDRVNRGTEEARADRGDGTIPPDLLAELPSHPAARAVTQQWLARIATDLRRIPDDDLARALSPEGPSNDITLPVDAAAPDLVHVAHALGVPLAILLRRMAFRPTGGDGRGAVKPGLVICDASGVPVLRLPPPGFAMARRDAPCPLWPLYDALGAPGRSVRELVETAGPRPRRFEVWAIAEPSRPHGMRGPLLVEATMLIVPRDGASGDARPVGPGCRACPREACAARREPSIVAV